MLVKESNAKIAHSDPIGIFLQEGSADKVFALLICSISPES